MAMRDVKTMIRVDPRLRAGLKRAAASRDYPLYLLAEKILWDWLASHEPDLARMCYAWKPPRDEDLTIRLTLPAGTIQRQPELFDATMDWTEENEDQAT